MSLIDVQNLTFAYGAEVVFENASFRIDTDWKLGFVGRNGRGKTTFLNLLAGKYEYSGVISASVRFTRFPYEVKDKSRTVEEILGEVCPRAEEWEILRELSCLKTDAGLLYVPFETLSGGEQTKILLAGLFLNDGDFLLIDEPTNHLDADSRRAVADYLRRKKGFILVSHDRAFLDGCIDHVLSINRADIEVRSGNFSSWLEDFRARQAAEEASNERLKRDVSRLENSFKRSAEWADKIEASKNGKTDSGLKADKGYVGHKAAKMMKRAKSIEARRDFAVEQKSRLLKNAETAESLKLNPLSFRSERLAGFSDLSITYGGRQICAPVNFEVLRGERIALDGCNGSGKSSILKLIAGEDIPHSGEFFLASGVKVSYVRQTNDGLSGTLSDFAKEGGVEEALFRAVLDKMGFENGAGGGDISRLSEGQKKKLMIARSLCCSAHLYVWDEPLNYLDIYSRLQLEELLKRIKPTMIFVEHDLSFREEVATRSVRLSL